jgi:hypothetical protein
MVNIFMTLRHIANKWSLNTYQTWFGSDILWNRVVNDIMIIIINTIHQLVTLLLSISDKSLLLMIWFKVLTLWLSCDLFFSLTFDLLSVKAISISFKKLITFEDN